MSDLGPFSRVLHKHAGRAKERILQNLGKADKTTDEEFDLHVKNFNRQHNSVLRLQKEFKNYHQCLKALQVARKCLMDTVSELYEPCWTGTDTFLIKSEELDKNLEDFSDKVNSQLVAPVNSYLCQFPEFATKISKRNRKLLDYDKSRHNLENCETMKKKEETKISKAKEHLDEDRRNFESINSELNDELPALFDSRVSFFASHLQCLFIAEAHFHEKDLSLFNEIGGLLESLDEEYKKSKNSRKSLSFFSTNDFNDSKSTEYYNTTALEFCSSGASFLDKEEPDLFSTPMTQNLTLEMLTKHNVKQDGHEEEINSDSKTMLEKKDDEFKPDLENAAKLDEFKKNLKNMDGQEKDETKNTTEKNAVNVDEIKRNVKNKTNKDGDESACRKPDKISSHGKKEEYSLETGLKHHVLYQVKSTYKYTAEDSDELSFDVGEIIDVVAYDDPDEQEDGWLMGVRDGKKGLFPANFTLRI